MKVLITGPDGFLGKSLSLCLAERKEIQVLRFGRSDCLSKLPELVEDADFIFHLAGVNRPNDPMEFKAGNAQLTEILCSAVASVAEKSARKVPIVLTSSKQAATDNLYGLSKRAAEDIVFNLQRKHGIPVHVFRLPNVFGKWAKPNYNSVVATFCHNVARGLPIEVFDPSATLTLVYLEDVIQRFISLMDGAASEVDKDGFELIEPQYTTSVGELAQLIESFKQSRQDLLIKRVGIGLERALYSTYISYLPPQDFSYFISVYQDDRGVFAEMLRTPDCGQFSFFTARPGVTRGGHYHHTKTEKFLVVRGNARFKFRNIATGENYELLTSADKAQIVETVPGWAHDITNIGCDDLIVLLWANEVFDRERPDTFCASTF